MTFIGKYAYAKVQTRVDFHVVLAQNTDVTERNKTKAHRRKQTKIEIKQNGR